jgi:hypothetical protein
MRRHHYKPYLGEGGIVSKPAVTTNGVMARYERFSHSGTTWYDLTPNPANGTDGTNGAAFTWPSFNGESFVNFGLPAKLDFTDAFTALVWANQSTAIPRQTKERVLSRDAGAGTNRAFILEQRDDTGIVSGYLWVGGGAAPNVIDSPAVYNTDTYHFICLVNEGAGGDIRLYVDGELIGTDAGGGGAMNLATSNLYAGRPHSGTDDFFTGLIDTVRLYGRALSADEILRDYYAGVPAHS